MAQLSDDDLNLSELSDEELDRAWDLWFTLAQTTNDDDPMHTHGVFVGAVWPLLDEPAPSEPRDAPRHATGQGPGARDVLGPEAPSKAPKRKGSRDIREGDT